MMCYFDVAVYTLWKHPDLLPSLSTWPPVLDKISGGAGLSKLLVFVVYLLGGWGMTPVFPYLSQTVIFYNSFLVFHSI